MKVKVFNIDDRDLTGTEEILNEWLAENKVDIKEIKQSTLTAYGWGNGSWLVITIFYEDKGEKQ